MVNLRAAVVAWTLIALATGCAGPLQGRAPDDARPHLEGTWFAHRAASLNMSASQAQARDGALSKEAPPQTGLDDTTSVEASVLWRDLCASCHGAKGKLQNVAVLDPSPRKWGTMGTSMGFFFGGDKMRAGIYRKISEGTEDPQPGKSVMPAWATQLSTEQIWALVRHIEGF